MIFYNQQLTHLYPRLLSAILMALGTSCFVGQNHQQEDSTTSGAVYCPTVVTDPDGDGWGFEYGRSCIVPPICAKKEADFVIDGWGWENEKSCRVVPEGIVIDIAGQTKPEKIPLEARGALVFDTTYYPHGNEYYPKTTCGDGRAHDEMYFAVTENSPLWAGSCNNDSWAPCTGGVCLEKWDLIPADAKRIDQGQKMVREPSCKVPCGQRHRVWTLDGSMTTTAVVYDACPSQHWNNRLNEITVGRNPCGYGSHHVDLRKPLYLKLNRGVTTTNISVRIDPRPL